MKMHRLSPSQLALTPQVRDDWEKIGLDTAPVDPAKVREILGRLYAAANKPVPKNIVFVSSPLEASKIIARMRSEGGPVCQHVSESVHRQVDELICHQPAHRIKEQAADLIGRQNIFETTVATVSPDLHFNALISNLISDYLSDSQLQPLPWHFQIGFGRADEPLPWLDFFGRLGIGISQLVPCFDLARNCGWAFLFWDWAFISAKPQWICLDERGRLHCETGAAIRYPDGFSIFAIQDVCVPEKVVNAPQSLTIPEIEFEKNAEVRRIMIERYGQEKFLLDSGAEEIHRDDFGILYRKEIPNDEPLVMVKVVNATAESDGSFKDYFLRVPPTMERSRQAVAWTFGKEENEYDPVFQT